MDVPRPNRSLIRSQGDSMNFMSLKELFALLGSTTILAKRFQSFKGLTSAGVGSRQLAPKQSVACKSNLKVICCP